MPTCSLRIELDDPCPTYRPGDQVRGTVIVEVDDDCDCQRLSLTCEWYTHGRTTPTTGSEQTQFLGMDLWHRGETHRYPFELRLPNGPCTYHGTEFSVDWRLVAAADIPWKSDPTAQVELDVVAGDKPVEDDYQVGDFRNQTPAVEDHRTAGPNSPAVVGCLFAFSMAFLGFCLFIILSFAGIISPDPDSKAEIFFMVVPAVVAAALTAIAWKFLLKNRLAEMRLGQIDVVVDRARAAAGDSFDVVVDIPPPSDADINEISLAFVGRERSAVEDGNRSTIHTYQVFKRTDTIEDSVDRRVPKGQSAHFEHTVDVPEDVPPSFRCEYARLEWVVDVYIDIADWPDWRETLSIDVLPPTDS